MKALHHLDKCEDGHHTDDSTHVIFIEHVQTCSLTRSKEKDMYPWSDPYTRQGNLSTRFLLYIVLILGRDGNGGRS
jgi:hypothetical protein